MKKIRRSSKATQNKKDEIFANKVICQMIASIVIFITVFANSKLSNPVSVKINNAIRHYICVSADFGVAVNNAKAYFDNFMNNEKSVPVNSSDYLETKEDN